MKLNKHYNWQLREAGWKQAEISEYTPEQLKKKDFVKNYLSPVVEKSDSGWAGVEYRIMENDVGAKEEFLFYISYTGELSCGICVTADSKTAIVIDCFDSI